jgi:branched-chain amino acid transport system permease protein
MIDYLLNLLTLINIYLILGLSLNILVGYSGLFSMCQAAFYGIGAYISSLLMAKSGINFFISLLAAIIGTMIVSLFVSLPSLRLKGDYFILATLSFQIIIFYVLYNSTKLTGGAFGIKGIPSPQILGVVMNNPIRFFFFSLFFALIAIIFCFILLKSPFGQVLKAIREDELLASTMGKDIFSFKVKAFAISAGLAALAGSLFASYLNYIDPSSFTINETIFILSIVIIGGGGNIVGPVIGTFLAFLIPEILKFLGIPDTIAPNLRQIIYGFLLIVFMYYRPQGVMGEYKLGEGE